MPLKNFYKHLNIPEDSNGTTTDGDSTNTTSVDDNTNESEYKIPAITTNVPASSSNGFNQVTGVTADIGIGDSNIFVTSSDFEAYKIMEKEGLF